MTSPRVQRHRKAEANRRKVTTRGKRVPQSRAKPPARRRKSKYQTAGMLGSFSGMFVALFAATGSVFYLVGAVASGTAGCASAYLEYRRDLIEVKRTGKPIGAKPNPAGEAGAPLQPGDPKPVDLDTHPQRSPMEAEWVAQQKRLDAIRQTPVTVHHRAGCPICARTDEHTHSRDDWEAISGTWEHANPRPPQRQAQPATRKSATGKHGPPGHEAKCTAKTKEACPYWRKANPGKARKTTTTKRASGGARRTK